MIYLSFLMAGKDITDEELKSLNTEVVETESDGDRKIKIPEESINQYLKLVEEKLKIGFWNEVVGEKEVIFIFKFKDGSIRRYVLSPENEKEIGGLCSQFNGDSLEKTANVYKYISGNSFYKDFMNEYYGDLIEKN